MTVYNKILHNGRFISKEDATLPVYTPTLLGALGVYETILVKNGRYVALDEHLERLFQSVKGAQMQLDTAINMDQLRQWAFLSVAANHPDGLMRILVMNLGHPYADIYFFEASYAPIASQAYVGGVPVILYDGERAMPRVKSFNTLVPGLARQAARAAGVHDALLVDRNGNVTEGSNCNVFVVQDGVLLAPPFGNVLEGTVMRRVMTLAGELAIPFRRQPLPAAAISSWDEAFLTSTRRRVLPVRRVDDIQIGKPGPITQRLSEAYWAWEEQALGGSSET